MTFYWLEFWRLFFKNRDMCTCVLALLTPVITFRSDLFVYQNAACVAHPESPSFSHPPDPLSTPGGEGGGEGFNKCLYGEAPPQGPIPYPFINHFSRKRYPFRIPRPSIDKWYPFHIPCLELCIPFNCCKCTVF